ncbi:MAG: 3-dehydroquinate synthase family protein [Bdellovibrionales bacterium]
MTAPTLSAVETRFQKNTVTNVEFLKKLPSESRLAEALGFRPEKYLVIYDKRLRKNESVEKWLRDFTFTYPVTAGEKLKDVHDFPSHFKRIFNLVSPFSARSLCVLALGGGTVGDFAGFVSSVMKRGVPLVHIPTTLLAAMDSAHGGKTGLNLGAIKNQVGSFYPANSVLIVRSLFEALPILQLQSASGELAKMALLQGGALFERFERHFKPDLETFWEFLPDVIDVKYGFVAQDPYEETGHRQVLNLGHTLGHALESYHGIAHGLAVGEGLIFAIQWSHHSGYLREKQPAHLIDLLVEKIGVLKPLEFVKKHRMMSRAKLAKFIMEDKKLTDTRHMSFIFLESIGRPFRKVVPLESFLTETQRQGWTAV